MELSEQIVARVWDELRGRSGFDEWWGSIDLEIQSEIFDTLDQIVRAQLEG